MPKCETGAEVGIDAVAAAAPAEDHESKSQNGGGGGRFCRGVMCGELKEWAGSIQEDREPEPEQPPETTDKTDEDLAEQDQEEVCGDFEIVLISTQPV